MNAANLEMPLLESEIARKKKILVLISEGGGGHKTAGESLREILSPFYDIEVLNVIRDIAHPIDFIHRVSKGKMNAEDFYNYTLRKGFHRFARFIFCRIGNQYMLSNRKKLKTIFQKYFEEQGENSPDLIISTVPMVNYGLASAAHQAKIPFLIMPTDLDTATFFRGLSTVVLEKGARFVFALPYEDRHLRIKAVQSNVLKAEQLCVTGFPVRPAFQKKYTSLEIAHFKDKHGMYQNPLTITIMGGATGGNVLFSYAKELATLQSDGQLFQVNICVGKNHRIGKKIVDWALKKGGSQVAESATHVTIKSAEGIFLHIRGFTPEIVEIMASSELIITKTGSCSVNEAIYLGKKVLLDNTRSSSARYLDWEGYNVPFVQKHRLGDAFSHVSELKPMVLRTVLDKAPSPSATGEFELPNFKENVLNLVARLFSTS